MSIVCFDGHGGRKDSLAMRIETMKGYYRITKRQFYAEGAFSNSRLVRTERSGRWTYWKSN